MKVSTSTTTTAAAAFGTAVLVALCVALRTSEAATAMQILPRNPGRGRRETVILGPSLGVQKVLVCFYYSIILR